MSEHFPKGEFSCRCGCGLSNPTDRLVGMLEVARSIYGAPMHILSGSRCPAHNASVGGKPSSAHLTGEAVDVACASSHDRFRLVKALLSVGFIRLGIGSGFVHADVSTTLPQEVMWSY